MTKQCFAFPATLFLATACSDPKAEIEQPDRLTVSEPVAISSPDGVHDVRDLALDRSGLTWALSTYDPHVSIFSEDGLLNRFGQPGSGPGELRNPHGFVANTFLEAAVAIWDPGRRAVQRFSADGELINELRIDLEPGLISSRLGERSYAEPGRLESFGAGFVQAVYPGQVSWAEQLWTGALVRINSDGEPADTLVHFSELSGAISPRTSTDAPPQLLAPVPLWASCSSRIALLSPPAEELLWIDPEGRIESQTIDLPHVPVTDADRSRFLRQQVALEAREEGLDPNSPEMDRIVEQILQSGQAVFAESAPPVKLLCGAANEIWVQLFSTGQDPRGHGRTWIRVLASGQEIVHLPLGFTPVIIEEDRIIGILKDQLERERVAVATLDRQS